MKQASIAQAKAQLSALIAHVKTGEEVLLTDRGRPVARIVPLQEMDDGVYARLVGLGVIVPPDHTEIYPGPQVIQRTGSLVDALLQERDEGY
ncbi:unnamed protein product [Phaeothamnion confervicola]